LFPVLSENDLVKHWDGWRRHDCEYIYAEGDLDSKRQCKRCKNLDKNMRAERFPELFPDERGGVSPETDCDDDDRNTIDSRTISEAVIENEEAFRGRIISRLESHWEGHATEHGGWLDVSSDEELPVAAMQMKLAGVLVLNLKDGRSLTCCEGDGCDKCFVRTTRANASTLCKECKDKRGNDARYAQRREDNRHKRVDPKSTVPLTSLSPEELAERSAALNRNRKIESKRRQRLLDKIEYYEKNSTIRTEERAVSEEMHTHMVAAAKDLADACEEKTLPERLQALIDELVEESPYENNDPISASDARRFVQSIANHLTNWVKEQQGHPSAVRFEDEPFAIAFNHYLRSPASFRQMKKDDCLVRPSESLFKKLKKEIGVKGGQSFDTAILQPFVRGDVDAESVKASVFATEGAGLGVNWTVDSSWNPGCGKEWGQLACDEATISQGMVTNSKNNVTRGITNDFFELSRVMGNIMDSDDIESMDRPATKVNQWWYRATDGRMFCVMSFFNGGSLGGDVILRQLVPVILACETVGSRVYLFACDAGGANQGTFKSLRGNRVIPHDMVWLDDEYIRFSNPYEPRRWIYMVHCSTHNLKNMRNRVKESKAAGRKCFLDTNGNMIAWDFIVQIHNEE